MRWEGHPGRLRSQRLDRRWRAPHFEMLAIQFVHSDMAAHVALDTKGTIAVRFRASEGFFAGVRVGVDA